MKVVTTSSNSKGIGKEQGEAFIQISKDKSKAYIQILTTTGEVEKVIKLVKTKEISKIDPEKLDQKLNAIISQLSVLNSAVGVSWQTNPSSISIVSKTVNDCVYAVSNTDEKIN